MDFNYIKDKLIEISGIEHLTLQSIFIIVFSFIGVFLLELILVGWDNSSLKRVLKFDKSIQNDLFYTLFETFSLFNFATFIVTFGSFYYLTGLIQKNFNFNISGLIQNPYLQFSLLLIVGDFKNYLVHFIFHKYNSLWKLHEFHHSATSMSIITHYRNHFFVKAVSTIFDAIFLVIVGAPLLTFLFIQIIQEIHRMLIHSSIKSDWGIIGKYILVSPSAHRIHHSVNPIHANKNFGSSFIIWDRIFKTYHPSIEITEFGIPKNPYNKNGVFFDFILVIKNTFSALFNKRNRFK